MSSIDTTSPTPFAFAPAKTEIKTVAKGAWILLIVSLVSGTVMLIVGSQTLENGDIANGAIRLTISVILFVFASSMIFAVGALHLHLTHLRAMESVQAEADASREQLVRDLRAEIQQVRDEEGRVAGLLTQVAGSAENDLQRRRNGN